MQLTWEELNLIRQWYNAVEDANPTYLTGADRQLARKIKSELIGAAVPAPSK